MYLVVFGSPCQVEGGVDFRSALLAERRQLKGDRLSQAVARLHVQLGRLSWDFVKVSVQK